MYLLSKADSAQQGLGGQRGEHAAQPWALCGSDHRSWNLEVLTSQREAVPGIHVQLIILQDPFEASHQPGRDPAFVHGPRRFLLDGAPATVDVVDVAAVELDDK